MELKWNLDELFESIEECYGAFATIAEKTEALAKYKGIKLTAESLKAMLDSYFEIKEIAYRTLVYGSLRYYKDYKNEEMAKLRLACENKSAEVAEATSFVEEAILEVDFDNILAMLQSDNDLKKYRVFLDDLFRRKKHAVATPEITEIKKEINDIIQEYNSLVNGITFDSIQIDGKEQALETKTIQKYLVAQNRATRIGAFKSLGKAYKEKSREFADIINRLFKKRVALAHLQGYTCVKEKALDEENIDPNIVAQLVNLVQSELPLLHEYMSLKAEHFQLEDPHLYDLDMPLKSSIKRKYPLEEVIPELSNIFAPLKEDYCHTAKYLLENGHIDTSLDDQKHPTMTFSWLSYSFLNYRNAYGDVKNLVHELGHSVNDYLSKDLPFPYRISSVFIGETASIVNEILLSNYMISKSSDDQEKAFYLTKEIDNYIASVYRQTMYTEFENCLYAKVEEGEELTSDYLSETYFALVKKYYGDKITYDEETAYEWTRLSHIIRWEFYPYRYATGLLIAATVHKNLLDGSLTQREYIDFLSSGCKEYSLDLLEKLHINPKDLSTLDKGFDTLKRDLKELQKVISKMEPHI